MKTVNGKVMFMLQARDLVRVTNTSGEELGIAGLLGRLSPTTDIIVWGQTFTHCGLHKDWERDRIDVERVAAASLSVELLAKLNSKGFIQASDLSTTAPKSTKKAEPEPEPETEPEPEPEPESVTAEPEPEEEPPLEHRQDRPAEPEEEADLAEKPKKKVAKKKKKAAKKKRTSKKKTE